ncbi:MAG TPA: GGDEF domain-containing protein [Actinomycetales bacterium]|nr:GGDEF domain-containing protein [Actinomycetales bacterium]
MERGDRGVLPGRVGRRAAPTRAELGVTAAALVGAAAATLLAVTLDTPGPAAVLVAGCAVPAVVRLRRAVVAALAGLLVSGLVACVLLVPAVEALPWLAAGAATALAVGVAGRRQRAAHDRARAEATARHDAVSVQDDLTGCCNRAGLLLYGNPLLQSVRRRGESMHALVVDVDGLGRVNARLGRDAGDEVLVAVAEALRASTRGTDVVARGDGYEFAVIGPGSGVSPGEMERRVRAHLVETPPAPLDIWPCRVTAGLAVLEPWDGGDVDDLVRRAYQDLSLRASLRAPSAPEPVHDRRALP